MLSPRRLALALGALFASGVLGCGSDSTDPGAAVTDTATATIDSGGTIAEPASSPTIELSGGDIRISYGPIAGVSTFTYEDKSQTTTFTGPAITLSLTPDGTMVSVLVHHSVEAGLATFSVLIPRVVLGPTGTTSIQTPGITTVHMVADRIALGQLDQYVVTPLQGTAHY